MSRIPAFPAVWFKEFGEIGIDHEWVVSADEAIFEMNNGCICCTVRGDLIRILGNLMKRRDKFDYILIETTGLADPGPVVQTFLADEEMHEHLKLDGIVTLVDAKHIAQHIDESREAQEQIAFADIILLNKTDLVSPPELESLEGRVRGINGAARVYRTRDAAIDLDRVLNLGGFNLGRALEVDPQFMEPEYPFEWGGVFGLAAEICGPEGRVDPRSRCDDKPDHEHDDEVSSVGIDLPGGLHFKRFHAWLSELLAARWPDIFRRKGVLSFAGQARRFVFQGVHMLFDGRPDRPGGEAPRRNALIFIGRNLDRESLVAGFRSCLI